MSNSAIEKAFAAAAGGYTLKKSRVEGYYFAVFRDTDALREYDKRNPEHFEDCELACYDGHLNAFYLGYLQ